MIQDDRSAGIDFRKSGTDDLAEWCLLGSGLADCSIAAAKVPAGAFVGSNNVV